MSSKIKTAKLKNAVAEEAAMASAAKVTTKEQKIFDLVSSELKVSDTHKKSPYVVLKYYKESFQCFSDWDKSELKQWTSFLGNLSQHTWQMVYSTGSAIPKQGLGYTKYSVDDVKSARAKVILKQLKKSVSNDIDFFELRVGQTLRVHGFQAQSAFFLVLLDRSHELFPM